MDKSKVLFLASMLAMAAILGGILLPAYTLDDEEGGSGLIKFECPRRQPWLSDISDDQKEEIRQLIGEMREAGSNPQEIKDAVDAKLVEWGIELPERPDPPFPLWTGALTDTQKEEIQQLVQNMKDAGASGEDIMNAVNEKLAEWGIEVPEFPEPQHPPWMRELTEEQREEIEKIIEEMKEDGASMEEIRGAVNSKLEEYGIDVPEFQGPQRSHLMSDLTEDQREDIRELVEKMKDEGASREEITEAIRQLLEELE